VSRLASTLAVGAALALGGCSLIWTPVTYDAAAEPPDAWADDAWAPDADLDAFDPDAGPDAPDAWVPPDAWSPPTEICSLATGGVERPEGADNDGDDLIDCDDPDCYGEAICCSDTAGTQLGGAFLVGEPPAGWELGGATLPPSRGAVPNHFLLDFGTAGGHVARTACTPLAAGAQLDVSLARTTRSTGDLSVVLSPAPGPRTEGFLDEMALRFAAPGGFRITRSDDPQVLNTLTGACASRQVSATEYNLPLPSRVVLEVRPGVSSGAAALLATVTVVGTFGGGCTAVQAVTDFPIALDDLVRPVDSRPESCGESPGLFVVLEGHGAAFEVGSPLSLLRFECASPSVFSGGTRSIERADLSATLPPPGMGFSRGGIGAPDLDFTSEATGARLLYDGSIEDRSSELFQTLTTQIGLSLTNARDYPFGWAGTPIDDGSPITGLELDIVREPTGLFADRDIVAYARSRGGGEYDLYRADTGGGPGGVWSALTPLAASDACSFREPALAPAGGGTHFVFFRCDAEERSTLGVMLVPETGGPGMILSTDLLAEVAPSIATRVRALDVVTRADTMAMTRYFAVWVLAEGSDGAAGSRTLHLFAGQAPEGTVPTLEPYAGNPVLREADLASGCTGSCTLTSFGVGLEARPGTDMLRFLFARTRIAGASTVYELVPRSQFAPRALGN